MDSRVVPLEQRGETNPSFHFPRYRTVSERINNNRDIYLISTSRSRNRTWNFIIILRREVWSQEESLSRRIPKSNDGFDRVESSFTAFELDFLVASGIFPSRPSRRVGRCPFFRGFDLMPGVPDIWNKTGGNAKSAAGTRWYWCTYRKTIQDRR